MADRKIIFMGYNDTGAAALSGLISAGLPPVMVVAPGGFEESRISPCRKIAAAAGIPFQMIESVKGAEFNELLTSQNPDLVLLGSFPWVIPKSVISLPKQGFVNVHGGLLPEQRGTNILNWAIALGLPQIGVTIHQVEPKVDAGAIYCRRAIPIAEQDDAGSLRQKLIAETTALVSENIAAIASGELPAIEQDLLLANYYRKRSDRDGRINWNEGSVAISRLISALVPPYPGAYFFSRSREFRVLKGVSKEALTTNTPGEVRSVTGNSIEVNTAQGTIHLTELMHQSAVILDCSQYFAIGDKLE